MKSRESTAADDSTLIDVTEVPLERLAALRSPALSRLIRHLTAQAGESEKPFDFSSAI